MSNTIKSLSLAEAATATGMNKSSILRAIKSGRISATRDELGQWRIEPGELFRVYPAVAPGDAPQRYAVAVDAMVAAMREQTMDVLVANLRDQIADLRGQRDDMNEHIEGDGPTVFAHACKMGLEGIVSKRKDSRYSSGRSPHWIKSKNPRAPAVKREADEDWGQWSLAKARPSSR
jgi:hypothetical protein